MVIVPTSIVIGIILLAILTFCSRKCISVKSIAGSSRASFIDSSNGSKFESSIQNLNQLPTMSMLHYPHAPNHIPLELPPNQNMVSFQKNVESLSPVKKWNLSSIYLIDSPDEIIS